MYRTPSWSRVWIVLLSLALGCAAVRADDVSQPSAELSDVEAVPATVQSDDEAVVAAVAPDPVDEKAFVPRAAFAVHKSDQDARDYRYLVLANNLRVLLISDPAAEKAAAALNVFVGHNQNPPERPGLAHFLEHMLFLGTEKYPLAGEYQTFISQHGGRYNAYTAPEHTNYFFEIDSAQLEPALDRFAQFFIAPLLDAEYVERERNAVHSEYRMRIKDDGRRNIDVYRELMNPAHPSSGFSVGTKDTLADREDQPVRNELIEFYQRYYSAHLMSAVVLGRESLDELQRMALPRLGQIPQREVKLAENYPGLFAQNFLPASVNIRPEKELRQLTFLFPIPADDKQYRKKPFDFIAHMLGHEGEGSLLSLLKQLGWAEKLTAGTGLKSRHDGFFYITIDLTETGVRASDQIPVLLLYVVQNLEARGLKDWRYHELQQMADINFRFQEKLPPMDTVRNLAQAIHLYEPVDVLQGGFLFSEYDEKLIKESLAYLRLDNLLLALIAPEVETDKHSFYYRTPYAVTPLKLRATEVKPAIRKRINFPEPNIFIPNRLSVKSPPLLADASTDIDMPQRVVDNERTRAWFQQDQLFHVPKTHIRLRLKLPAVARDAEGAAQAHLFAALVRDQLNEFSYPASLAGLSYSVKANPRGLDIEVAGYSSRQGLLLTRIADGIRRSRFSQERFNVLKAELIRDWRNQHKNSPYQIMLPQIAALQFEPYWSDQALSAALEDKTFAEFQQFSSHILRDGQLDALLYGNIYRQEAIKLAALAEHQLLGIKTGAAAPVTRVYQLASASKPWLFRYPLEHDDHIMLLYVQGLVGSPVDAAHMQLLQQILRPAFFDELRTEKQLGYVVSVLPLALRSIEGSVFVVQSPATDEAQLATEIDEFLTRQQELITAHLRENQQALVRRLNEPARSLDEQAGRLWESILLDDQQFSRRRELAIAAAAITPESLSAYFRQVMLDPNRRLWLSSTRLDGKEFFHQVEDIPAYRAQQKSLSYR